VLKLGILYELGWARAPRTPATRIGPDIGGWTGRAQRAHGNMLENLILFAILVFAAKVAGVSNAVTLLGAQILFWGRVAHAILYIAGIPWARTGAWAVSIVGLILIFWQLVL
jgi:uncharacterized MAPEG superfamily protein